MSAFVPHGPGEYVWRGESGSAIPVWVPHTPPPDLAKRVEELTAENATLKKHDAELTEWNKKLNAQNEEFRAENAELRKDAMRWRLASTSRQHGITDWHQFGQRTVYDKLAEQVIDSAIEGEPR